MASSLLRVTWGSFQLLGFLLSLQLAGLRDARPSGPALDTLGRLALAGA